MSERVIGQGEVIQATSSREGLEEEAAEIARLNETASKTRIDPNKRREDLLREQQRQYEQEKAEAERIASLLGPPVGTTAVEEVPVEGASPSSSGESEKEKKQRLEKEKKAKEEAAKRAKAEEEKRLKADKAEEEKRLKAAKAEEEKRLKAEKAEKAQMGAEANAKAEAEASAKATTSATNAPSSTSNTKTSTTATVTTTKTTTTTDEKAQQKEALGLSFQDSRSGLSISTSLTDAEQVRSESIAPVVAIPKRQFATEESIFGTQTRHKELDLDSLPPTTTSYASGKKNSASLFGDDDDDELFSKVTRAIGNGRTVTSVTTTKPAQVDQDQLFSMLDSASSSKSTSGKKTASTSSQAADDLFAMLDSTPKQPKQTSVAKKSSIDSGNFDIDSFIKTTKSGGGLFDD